MKLKEIGNIKDYSYRNFKRSAGHDPAKSDWKSEILPIKLQAHVFLLHSKSCNVKKKMI